MSLRLAGIAITLTYGFAFAAIEPSQSTKPIRDNLVHVDGRPNPATELRQMWLKSDIVVDGSIEVETPADLGNYVVTTYQVKVNEWLKSDPRWNDKLGYVLVTRPGGLRDRGAYILRTFPEDFPLFVVGERYILFLNRLRGLEYEPSFGPESAFQVKGSTLHAVGKSALARTLGSQSPAGIRALILKERVKQE